MTEESKLNQSSNNDTKHVVWRESRSFSDASNTNKLVSLKHNFSSTTNLSHQRNLSPKKRIFLRRNTSLTFQGIYAVGATFLFKLDKIQSPVTCISFVGDSSIWMGTERGSILIWDKKTIQLSRTIQFHSLEITCLKSINGNIWVGSKDGSVSIWNPENLKQIKCLKFKKSVKCIACVGIQVWIGCESKIYCYSKNITKQNSLKLESEPNSIVYNEQYNQIWVGLDSGDIKIYTIIDHHLTSISIKAHSGKINCLKECNNNIWSGSSDGTMKVWSINTHECIKELDVKTPVLTFECNQNTLWGISHKGNLNMYDGNTLSMEYEVQRRVQMGCIITLSIIPVIDNGKVVSTNIWLSSADCTISVWKILAASAFKEKKQKQQIIE